MPLTKEQKVGLGLGAAVLITAVVVATRAKAAPPVVICTPGDEKCIGPDWCRCNPEGTKWDVVTPNATECAAPPLTAILYGTVTDIDIRAPIGGINVNCNGYADTTAPDGTHRIENIPPSEYSVVFTDPLGRYETKEMSKTLVAGLNRLDVNLTPVYVPPEAYEIVLSDLRIHPSPTLVNQPVEISCKATLSVAPVGVPVTKTVTLIINGATVDSKDVSLTREYWPASTTVSFEFIPESIGTYDIQVDDLSDILEVVTVLDYEVIEPVLVKSLDYPPGCNLGLTNAEFTIGSEVHVFEEVSGEVELDFTYHPFSFNCFCDYYLTSTGYIRSHLIAVEESSYQAWLDGLIRDDGHYRQAWKSTVHHYYSTYIDKDISHSGSCDLGKSDQIMLDINRLDFNQIFFDPTEQQSHILPAGKYRILLWFDLACDAIRDGRLVTARAYGARIHEIGNATIP